MRSRVFEVRLTRVLALSAGARRALIVMFRARMPGARLPLLVRSRSCSWGSRRPRRGTGRRNSARWTVALAPGLRQSEALALQWGDIDLLNNSLSVRRTIDRVEGGGLVYEAPKTKPQRTLAAHCRQWPH